MEKFFHTYFADGFVGINELASVLLEATTGFDMHQAELARCMRASMSSEDLAACLESLAASDDPFDRFIVESLSRMPVDEDALSHRRCQVEQWEESIEAAAKDNAWPCLDLHSLAPVSPGSDFPYCVNVRDVIGWLSSVGHSPALGNVLESMLAASRSRNELTSETDQIDRPGLSSQVGQKAIAGGTARVTRDSSKNGTIAGLMASLPKGKISGKDLEKAAASVGVEISDDTIRSVLAEVRKFAPKLPK